VQSVVNSENDHRIAAGGMPTALRGHEKSAANMATPSSGHATQGVIPNTRIEIMFEPSPQIMNWLLLAVGIHRLWYAVPLIASVSLVYAATRHEEMGPILVHGVRFAIWILVFMGIVAAVLQLLAWLQ
jgi:hypothetical protein